MKSKLIIFFLLVSYCFSNLGAQDFSRMVNHAFGINEQLKAKNFEIDAAIAALKESKAMYGPSASLGGQYTLTSGGRSLSFPVGDLLNPVYGALNALTSSNAFPQISNVNEQFLPNNFYDARFRITQPIFYPDLAINKKIKQESLQLKQLEIKAFKRHLSHEIMKAYFQYVASQDAILIFNHADTLLNEAKRTTTSMVKNGVALPSALSRIETQMAIIAAQKIESESNRRNAERFLRFLINEPGTEPIQDIQMPDLPDTSIVRPQTREEISQLNSGLKLQSISLSREAKFYQPKVGIQLDLGSQAFKFAYKPYALLGVNVEMSLFDSKRHSYRTEQIKAELQATEHQKYYAEEQIMLQTSIAKENLKSSIEQAKTYQTRIAATNKIYLEILKKYKEGVANYLELIDAQTQVTQLGLQYNLAKNNAWVRWAEFVYAIAGFPID